MLISNIILILSNEYAIIGIDGKLTTLEKINGVFIEVLMHAMKFIDACCSGLLGFDTVDVLGSAVHPFAIVGRVFHRDVYIYTLICFKYLKCPAV